ncbi:MAG: nitronate monooxygenase [Gammaproteobacteria bacterium]|nr:MAG: nitronate monooxygenase [Gammaproteobacteria bacterium]
MQTELQKMLGLELPIIQAPMAGVQGSALAIAVSNAGGLGSLPCAMLDIGQIRDELGRITEATNKPYNVNFFCHQPPAVDARREAAWRNALKPYYDEFGLDIRDEAPVEDRAPFGAETLEVIQAFSPPVVSFHFGLPADDLLQAVRAMGSKILCSATTVEEAKWLEAKGVDAIIAQGLEAGGHRGMFLSEDVTTQIGSFSLLPQVIDAVDLPVIAAGGIADADVVAAAIGLGAAAVQIGTTFLLCDEATTSDLHRAALKHPSAAHTALSNRFSGRPARGIVNRIMRELGPLGDDVAPFPRASIALGPLRKAAEARGLTDFTSLWSGQNASGCREIAAAEMTRRLAQKL